MLSPDIQEDIYHFLLNSNIKIKGGITLGAGFDSDNNICRIVMFSMENGMVVAIYIYVNGDIKWWGRHSDDFKKVNLSHLKEILSSL